MMENEKDRLVEINKTLVKTLDDLLASEEWMSSPVLKVSAKKLQSFRDQAQALLDKAAHEVRVVDEGPKMIEDKEGFIRLYVLMFQSEGRDLLKWHARIKTLGAHQVSLPIYSDKNTVMMALRGKNNPSNYGYVEVLIDETKINQKLAGQQDSQGHELVAVHAGAIRLDHIRWFCDGKDYYSFDPALDFKLIKEMEE
jgi:intracellular multiplication protein IcmQ